MRIYWNDPVCDCGDLCANSTTLPPAEQLSDRPIAEQDASAPTSFFRLPREVRDKIYFLTSRPDCAFSFGKTRKCEKQHVHQSAAGRKASWLWLSLCRRTWVEAIVYMPMESNVVKVKVDGTNCKRCWHDRERRVKEGVLHANSDMDNETDYVDELPEIALARAHNLHILVEISRHVTRDCNKDLDRVAHNLRSFAASLAKFRNLQQVEVLVPSHIQEFMLMHTGLAEAVRLLFANLLTRPHARPVKVNIRIRDESTSRTPGIIGIQPSPKEEVVVGALLKQVKLAGMDAKSVTFLPKIHVADADIISTDDLIARIMQEAAEEKRAPISDILWQARVFDDDFDPSYDDSFHDDKLPWVHCSQHKNSDGPGYSYVSGCLVYSKPKYSDRRKFWPLYLEKDFYHVLAAANQAYRFLPECQSCGCVFATHTEADVHSMGCERAG